MRTRVRRATATFEPLEGRRLLHGVGGPPVEPIASDPTHTGQAFVDVGNVKTPFVSTVDGRTWGLDVGSRGGKRAGGQFEVAGTEDDALFTTRRTGKSFTYSVGAIDGFNTVTLLFVDTAKRAGKRVFNIEAEGKPLEQSLDVFARTGAPRTALVIEHTISVTGNTLDLTFTGVKGKAVLSAVSVERFNYDTGNHPAARTDANSRADADSNSVASTDSDTRTHADAHTDGSMASRCVFGRRHGRGGGRRNRRPAVPRRRRHRRHARL